MKATAMSEEPVRFMIEGDEPASPSRRHSDADAHAAAEMGKARAALADAAAAKNELLQAKRQQAAVHLDRINAEAEHATQGYHQVGRSAMPPKLRTGNARSQVLKFSATMRRSSRNN